ncbi:xanthine dehydrogenase family protein molybdopterin-binding subunit [Pseudonocardia ailaonensis]|uniref:xanthine dehydrogenase family protein molybdopterin-binding subunit n=1 Tax=Pseudonocardia ailaonensis TaxID=367279 RepID=UPI0031D9D77C
MTPGQPVRRRDGDLLVTGHALYVDDFREPGTLHMAVLRSPHPHARISSIDTTSAMSVRGVRAIVTGKDVQAAIGPVPHWFDPANFGGNTSDFPALPVDEVVYAGQPVVAAAAESKAQAEAALAAVRVEYVPLPFVTSVPEAIREDAPLVFGRWDRNVALGDTISFGDAAGALERADHRASDTFSIQRYQTAPLEPRAYLARWGRDGRLTYHCNTQSPHQMRGNLAAMFGVPEPHVRVITPKVGGAFGHKFHGYPEEPLVALMAKTCGAPVKWIESREEAMLVGAREFEHDFEVGFMADGEITAIRSKVWSNVGALGAAGGWPMTVVSAMTIPGPYEIPNTECSYEVVVSNKAPWNGARGYGKESAAIVLERMVEMVAERLGMDPVAVRLRNFPPPEVFPHWLGGKRLDSGNYAVVLERAVEMSGYRERRRACRDERTDTTVFGVGIGFELTPEGGDWHGGLLRGFDTSTVRMDPSGDVTVLTGVTSPGTGNETGIAQVVAFELGVEFRAVTVLQGDTDTVPYGFGNSSSRSLNLGGASAALACRELRVKLVAAAAYTWNVPGETIHFRNGRVGCDGDASLGMTIGELAYAVYTAPMPVRELMPPQLEATATYWPANLDHDPPGPGGITHTPYPTFPYSAHVAQVAVDVETGLVKLVGYDAVHDCGTVVNPMFVEGQFHGAIAMGLGGALSEMNAYGADGMLQSTTFKTYLPIRATDLPDLRTDHVVTPSPVTLLGTKGAGEGGVGGALAAVMNAVNDAVGQVGATLRRFPARPPAVLAALQEARR